MGKKNNRRLRRAALAAISGGGILAMAGGGDAAPLNSNLVVNGGFENVDLQSTGAYSGPQILDWLGAGAFAYSHDGSSSSAGVVPNYAEGGPLAGGGHWYFTSNNAGPTSDINAAGQFFQNINVSEGATGALIASGTARFDLGAFMSSYLNDTDVGNVHVEFFDAGSASLGTAVLLDSDPGPDNVWNPNSLSGAVPIGSANVRLSLFGTRTAGGPGPDGYIDNVTFSVVPEPSAVGLASGLFAFVMLRRRGRDGP
jgi:hypothetical protein